MYLIQKYSQGLVNHISFNVEDGSKILEFSKLRYIRSKLDYGGECYKLTTLTQT